MKKFIKGIKTYLKDEFAYFSNTIRTIRATRSGNYFVKLTKEKMAESNNTEKILIDADSIQLPKIIDKKFSDFLQKFIHSFRNKNHPTININNLLILSGPEKNGKSWFLRHNLKTFEEEIGNKTPLAIHYDIRDIPNQNFSSFLFNFEEKIISSILERNLKDINKTKKDIVTIDDLMRLLFFRWEAPWIEICINKAISRCLNVGAAYTFRIDAEYEQEMLTMRNAYERKAFKEAIYTEDKTFDNVLEMIAESMEVTKTEACIRLIHDCLIQREDFGKPKDAFESELYRTGLHVIEYLFDVLNFIAGYHEEQLNAYEHMAAEEKLPIHPHIVLALESVQEIFEMKDAERRPMDYIQTIMLRLYNNEGYRNHFPIVLETNKTFYFDRKIYDQLYENKWVFPTLIYTPTEFYNGLDSHLDKFFNNYQKTLIHSVVGDSGIHFYNLYLETAKANPPENFPFAIQAFTSEKIKLKYKINKVYIHPQMAQHLDDGTVDYEVIDHLLQWRKVLLNHPEAPYITLRRFVYDAMYLNQPTTIALMDEGITFWNKYTQKVQYAHYINNYLLNKHIFDIQDTKMSSLRKFWFKYYYRVFRAFIFSVEYYTIGKKKYKNMMSAGAEEYSSREYIYGHNLKWDVPEELYKGNFNRRQWQTNGLYTDNMY